MIQEFNFKGGPSATTWEWITYCPSLLQEIINCALVSSCFMKRVKLGNSVLLDQIPEQSSFWEWDSEIAHLACFGHDGPFHGASKSKNLIVSLLFEGWCLNLVHIFSTSLGYYSHMMVAPPFNLPHFLTLWWFSYNLCICRHAGWEGWQVKSFYIHYLV